MKGIAIIGSKGGTGKTSISHSLSLGAAWHNTNAIMCHTDNREPLKTKGRPYLYIDARDPKVLSKMTKLVKSKEGLFIIDGGGNRPLIDKWIAPIMDLIIIPLVPDPESIKQAIKDYRKMKKAGAKNIRYVVNKYPSNKFEREHINKYFIGISEDDILCYVSELKSIRTLLNEDYLKFKTPTSKVNNLSRSFYKSVMENLTND